MMKMIALVFVVIFLFGIIGANSVSAEGCFSVVVGKEASANGHVLIAHTEDFSPPQIIGHSKLSGKQLNNKEPDYLITSRPAGREWSRIVGEVPGEKFSDCLLNECGVVIASNQCPSRQDDPELTGDGIGKELRHRVAEKAISARDGIRIAGGIVEKIGYNSSGRTYVICDPDEGWFFCVIGGKHWLAHRVADDEVAVLANSFTVREINLADTNRFLASDSLVEYATSRGWYKPEEDNTFDFGKVFADSAVASGSFNVCRQWSGLRHLTSDTVRADWNNLPFSLKPDTALDVTDLMTIMRDHYENTRLYILAPESSNPHTNKFMTICSQITQMSFIAELRSDKPKEIGFLYWLCLGKPCTSFYVPFYFGLTEFPRAYRPKSADASSKISDSLELRKSISEFSNAYTAFTGYCHYVDSNYTMVSGRANNALKSYHIDMMAERKKVETAALMLYKLDKQRAIEKLQEFTDIQIKTATDMMKEVISE